MGLRNKSGWLSCAGELVPIDILADGSGFNSKGLDPLPLTEPAEPSKHPSRLLASSLSPFNWNCSLHIQ